MKRFLYLIILCCFWVLARAQHNFQGVSLSKALIELDRSSKHYDISFVYDELEDFTVTKTIKRGRPLPEAVREVCGFYPVRVSVKGRDILVECIQKDRTKLTGRLVGQDHQPIAYANIALSSLPDTTYVGGGVSNEAGHFVIPCGAERARVRISCVGFKTIERVMPIGDAGTIHMQMENYYLDNVTVNGRMPIIRSEADRLQYIVGNDEFAHGLSAHELLNRVPMVSVAGNSVMILGKGPARFMLNGHFSETGSDIIQQKLWTMRSEDIERIEVISIPSGRDLRDFGSGYINIVLRRDQTFGWRGDISIRTGKSDDWTEYGSASATYASEKYDMTIDVSGGQETTRTDEQSVYGLRQKIYSNILTEQKNKDLSANLQLRYYPTKGLELGGMLSYQLQWPHSNYTGDVTSLNYHMESDATMTPNKIVNTMNFTAYGDWQLDSLGKRLSLSYSNYKKADHGISSSYYEESGTDPLEGYHGYDCNADYHIQTARLDLTMPLAIGTVDAGIGYTDIRNNSNSRLSKTSTEANDLSSYNTELDYNETTKSAYISLHHEWEKLSFRASLRYERIDMKRENSGDGWVEERFFTNLREGALNNENSKTYWLPSLSISFIPAKEHLLNLTWGTSCERPNFYDLNPFRIYKTGQYFFQGCPFLQPSRVSNLELTYHNNQGVFASLYHHHGSNIVSWFTYAYISEQPTRVDLLEARTMPGDIANCNQSGLYLRYRYQLSSNILATADGNLFYHDASKDDDSYRLHGWGKKFSLTADWFLNRQHTLMLNANYQHWFSDYHVFTKTKSYGHFCFALRYMMLDNNLNISIVATDPFRQHVTDEVISSSTADCLTVFPELEMVVGSMDHSVHTRHHTHYIGISASYSFGGKKIRRIRHDKEDIELQRANRK